MYARVEKKIGILVVETSKRGVWCVWRESDRESACARVYTYICVCVRVCVRVCVHFSCVSGCSNLFPDMCVDIVCVRERERESMGVCVYVHVCVCMCVSSGGLSWP